MKQAAYLGRGKILLLNATDLRNNPPDETEKSVFAQSFSSKISASSVIDLLFFASLSMVPTIPFTIPRKKRSALISYRQKFSSKTQREYSMLQVKDFTCVFFLRMK